MDKRILELLIQLGFYEHPEKSLLYQKQVDENTTAYIDFRREHNGSAEGRRFAKRGDDFIDDPDEIEVLRHFKTERDRLFEQKVDIVSKPAKHEKKELAVGSCEALAVQYGIPLELANMFFKQFDSQMYIKNPGLLYLANKKGYSRIEIVDKFDEKTGEWSAECKIYPRLTKEILEGIGKLAPELQKQGLDFATAPTNGMGRASKDNVMTSAMQPFLREMAQTRAMNRALRAYTGYGGTSAEELPEGQIEQS